MKPMLPTLHLDIPIGDEWVYETKYDGFRSLLTITEASIHLMSRNEKSLDIQFPEIIQEMESLREHLLPFLPLTIDGEIVYLTSKHFSDFEQLQIRGRLKSIHKIMAASAQFPCKFAAFDLLELNGKSIINEAFVDRKKKLIDLFNALHIKPIISAEHSNLLQYVPYTADDSTLWEEVRLENGEGIIAKQRHSKWESGARTMQWLKIKNYKRAPFIITGFDKSNSYFQLSIFKKNELISVGSFSHGATDEEREALLSIIKANKRSDTSSFIEIDPAIVVDIQFLSVYKGQLREPSFHSFRFDLSPGECTWDRLMLTIAPIAKEVQFTHLDKPLWETVHLTKAQFLSYLYQISDLMLPFIKNRLLTTIRFPHGMFGEAFYQKNCPDYAPNFIKTVEHEDIDYIVCNDLSTLLWLGNQLAFEFHVPFQTIDTAMPTEIVFDLDPPSKDHFPLAIKAALEMKLIFDRFGLVSFPKLSGNKGLQIHIPLAKNSLSYEQTRRFTEFIAEYVTTSFPSDFTVERLKKNRGNRLYIDYIQHAEGKTIIAPYSLRGKKEGAFIAAPLYWEEVDKNLSVEEFTIEKVLKRKETMGCPLKDYYTSPQDEQLQNIIRELEKHSK